MGKATCGRMSTSTTSCTSTSSSCPYSPRTSCSSRWRTTPAPRRRTSSCRGTHGCDGLPHRALTSGRSGAHRGHEHPLRRIQHDARRDQAGQRAPRVGSSRWSATRTRPVPASGGRRAGATKTGGDQTDGSASSLDHRLQTFVASSTSRKTSQAPRIQCAGGLPALGHQPRPVPRPAQERDHDNGAGGTTHTEGGRGRLIPGVGEVVAAPPRSAACSPTVHDMELPTQHLMPPQQWTPPSPEA